MQLWLYFKMLRKRSKLQKMKVSSCKELDVVIHTKRILKTLNKKDN